MKFDEMVSKAPEVEAELRTQADADEAALWEENRRRTLKNFNDALKALGIDPIEEERICTDGGVGYVPLSEGVRLYLQAEYRAEVFVFAWVRRDFPEHLIEGADNVALEDPGLLMPSIAPGPSYRRVQSIIELQASIVDALAYTEQEINNRVRAVQEAIKEAQGPFSEDDADVIDLMQRTLHGLKGQRILRCDEEALYGFAIAVINLYDPE